MTSAEALHAYNRLSERQRQVFRYLVTSGNANKVIAFDLGISPTTASIHTGDIYRAFGVHSRVELLHFALKNGLL